MKNNKYKVLVLDNFDSFTYNLVAYLRKLGVVVVVLRTDSSIEQVMRENPTHIVLSPGPGHPREVILFQEVLQTFKENIPILGVCLGLQAIGIYFGARVEKCSQMMHGKTSPIIHNSMGVFEGISQNPLKVCRYHSLGIVSESIPKGVLLETAWAEDGTIMGIESCEHPNVVGVQFHPESYFTDCGLQMLRNFLSLSC